MKTDLIIKNIDWIISVNKQREIIKNGYISIKDGLIHSIGRMFDIPEDLVADEIIHAYGMLATPGLIDCHIHNTFQMARGLADDTNYHGFLFERMYPYESSLNTDDIRLSHELCMLELMSNGVTTFVDAGNYQPDITAEVVGKSGQRCILSHSTFDQQNSTLGNLPKKLVATTDELLKLADQTVKKYNGCNEGRTRGWLQFRGLNNSSDELIRGLKQIADAYRVGIQTHACFAEGTVKSSCKQHGITEIQRLHKLGCLDSNLLLAHVGWASKEELDLIKEFQVKVVAAPSSSLHNAYGNFLSGHLPELMDCGVAVGLGSDHSSSGIVDILQEMFLVTGGYKEARLDHKVMPAEKAIEMATINGARCCLWEDQIGSLEVGKQADLVLFDTTKPEWQPLYNPLSNLVNSVSGRSVDTVIVAGKMLIKNGIHQTLDKDKIIAQVKKLSPQILKKTGLWDLVKPQWPIVK